MSRNYHRPSNWRKSWDDANRFMHSPLFIVIELVCTPMSGVVAGIFSSSDWTTLSRAWFGAGVSIAAGFLLVMAAYVIAFVASPFRLLREFDREIQRLQSQLATPRLDIEVRQVRPFTMEDSSQGIVPPWASHSNTLIVVETTLKPSLDIHIDRVEIHLENPACNIKAFNAPVGWLRAIQTHEFYFVIPSDRVSATSAYLWILAGGKEWVSSNFKFDIKR